MQNGLKKSIKFYLVFFAILVVSNVVIISGIFAVFSSIKKDRIQANLLAGSEDGAMQVDSCMELLQKNIFTFAEHQTKCDSPAKIVADKDFFIGFTFKNPCKASVTSVTLYDSYFDDAFVYTTSSDVNKIEGVETYYDNQFKSFVSSVKIRILPQNIDLRTIKISFVNLFTAEVMTDCVITGNNDWTVQPVITKFTDIECKNKTLTVAINKDSKSVRVRINNSDDYIQSESGVIDLQQLNLSGGETLFCTYVDKFNQEIAYDFASITLYKAEWDDQYTFCEIGKYINYLPEQKYNTREFFFGWCIATYNDHPDEYSYKEFFEMIDNKVLYKWQQNMHFVGLYRDREHCLHFMRGDCGIVYYAGLVTDGIIINSGYAKLDGIIQEKNVFINLNAQDSNCTIFPEIFSNNHVIESLNLSNVKLINGSLTNMSNLKEIVFSYDACNLEDNFVVNCPRLQAVYFDQEPLNGIPKCLSNVNVYVKGKLVTKSEIISWGRV